MNAPPCPAVRHAVAPTEHLVGLPLSRLNCESRSENGSSWNKRKFWRLRAPDSLFVLFFSLPPPPFPGLSALPVVEREYMSNRFARLAREQEDEEVEKMFPTTPKLSSRFHRLAILQDRSPLVIFKLPSEAKLSRAAGYNHFVEKKC